ncbi:MAG: hypothetical protein KKB51_23880 [Candidatus Riflebacteria bacterium]|nr:hypothetical protein [Candidatus Riflebacteria bacterium]
MEEKRQRLVWIIFGVFLAIIFEGVLRKWIFPEHQKYLFFIRDPFVIFAYGYAIYANLAPKQGILFYLVIFFTLTISVFSFFQTLSSHLPWWIIAYSWRTHFLMLPLAILIGSFVTPHDLKRLFRFTLRLTPIYFALVYFQSINLQDHWINAGTLGRFRPADAAQILTRTEGFFTSSVGNAIFVGFLVAILLTVWVKDDWADVVGNKELYAYTVFTSAILVVSGQRVTYLLASLILTAGFFATLSSRRMIIRYLKPTLAIIGCGMFFLFFVFPQHRFVIFERFSTPSSGGIEGMEFAERTINDLTDFYKEFALRIPLMGLGIGYSSNAAYRYNITVIDLNSEAEWGRHIIELGPYFGFLVILFRTFIFLYLLFLCLNIGFKHKTPVPMFFFAALGQFLLFGQLTGNGIASGFIWFLAGIVLALIHHASEKPVEQNILSIPQNHGFEIVNSSLQPQKNQ